MPTTSSTGRQSPNLKSADALQRKRDRRRRYRQRKKYLARMAEIDRNCGTQVASSPNSCKPQGLGGTTLVEYDISHVVYSECWYANVKIGGVIVEALIDSGAEMSLLSTEVYNQLSEDGGYDTKPSAVRFRGIGGAQPSLGTCMVDLTFGGNTLNTNMHVVHLNGLDCILGMDTLKSQDISFHLGKGLFTFSDGTTFQLQRHAKKSAAKVLTKSPNTIKARTACFVQATLPKGASELLKAKEGIVEPLQSLYDSQGLIVSCSMVTKSGSYCPIYVVNPNDHDVELAPGTPLASFSLTTESHEVGSEGFNAVYDVWRCAREEIAMPASADPLNEDCEDFKISKDPPTAPLGCELLPPHLRGMKS